MNRHIHLVLNHLQRYLYPFHEHDPFLITFLRFTETKVFTKVGTQDDSSIRSKHGLNEEMLLQIGLRNGWHH